MRCHTGRRPGFFMAWIGYAESRARIVTLRNMFGLIGMALNLKPTRLLFLDEDYAGTTHTNVLNNDNNGPAQIQQNCQSIPFRNQVAVSPVDFQARRSGPVAHGGAMPYK